MVESREPGSPSDCRAIVTSNLWFLLEVPGATSEVVALLRTATFCARDPL